MNARHLAAGLAPLLALCIATQAAAQPHPSGHGRSPGRAGEANAVMNQILSSPNPIGEMLGRAIVWETEFSPPPNDDEATDADFNRPSPAPATQPAATPTQSSGSGSGAAIGGALGSYTSQGGGGMDEGYGDSVMSEDGYESVSYSSIYNDYSIDPGGDQGVTVTALEQSEFDAELEPVLDVLCGR